MSPARSIAAGFFLLLAGLSLPPTARALDPHQALLHYGHQSWQTDNGLPQNTVRAVLQTPDGYLWLATDGGLVRFDGVQFVVYDRQSAAKLRSNVINCLFEDNSGNLWIGTADGLTRRRGSEFITFTKTEGLPGNNIATVYQDRSGELWALTSDGAAALVNGRFQSLAGDGGAAGANAIVESPNGRLWLGTDDGPLPISAGQSGSRPQSLSHLQTQGLAASPDGRIWIGTRAGLEIVGEDGRVTTLNHQQGLPSDEVTALLPDRTGRMWIGTANGLASIPISGLASTSASAKDNGIVTYSVKDGLPGERIQMLYADREGAIWVSTNRGVARFEPGQAGSGKFASFGPRNGLSSDLVLCMFEDREGSLWMGTESGGLTVLRDQKFTTYTAANGLSEDLVSSVYQDRKGTLWIGTNGGGLDRLPTALDSPGSRQQAHFSNLTTVDGLSSNVVLALADDSAGDLWIGTPDGLDRLHDGHVKVYTSADGLADDLVRSLYSAPDGTLWIGTRRGLSRLEDGSGEKGRFTSYTSTDGLGSNLVGALLQGAHGGKQPASLQSNTLWVGTLGGLSGLRNGKFTTLTTRDGLSSNVVTALHETADGILWIAVAGGGLNRLQNGAVFAYPLAATGLPENIYSILGDSRREDAPGFAGGDLWLSSDKGIFRVSIADLNAFATGKTHKLMPSVYGTADGMAISECSSGGHPAAWRLRDGRLAFATLKGVAIIDPQHAPNNAEPPPVAIEQLTYDDRPVIASGPLALPPGQGRVAIEYTAMSFIAPQKVRFRYKLEGFDHDWIDAGARRTAFYTNLPPAHYTFRVLACNNDGVWNETGAALEFRLRPHLYQTWIFRLLLLLIAALAGYALYRRRVQRVEAQFGAVLAERGRIAREIHDTLAQSLVAISTQLEVVSRLLASSTDSAREHLDQARVLTRNSLTEARASIWDLRSQSSGLGAATEDLAARMSAMAARVAVGTSIKIQSKVGGAYHPLPAKLESELLRIAQEAATNAVRHAEPRLIAIDLQFERRLLTMTIEDDGRGFSGHPHPQSSGPAGHFGLTGMRERAEQIGGQFTIESAPGQGTRIQLMVPIE